MTKDFERDGRLRFLVATVPAAGHVHPAVPVAAELVRRGHQVTWLTGRMFQGVVETVGARFEPLAVAHDPADASLMERFPERAGLRGLAGIRFDLKHVFLDEIPGQVDDLRRILDEIPVDLVVADAGFMGAGHLHELGGPRWATIGITPLPLPSRDTAPFGTGLPPVRSLLGRLRSAALTLAQRAMIRDVEQHFRTVRSGLGLPPAAVDVLSANVSPFLFLQSGTQAFEYPRSDLPDQVHFVGPLLSTYDHEAASTAGSRDWEELANGRPLILLTQGTVATAESDLIAPSLEALADQDVYVVAVSPTADTRRPLPANVVLERYVPYHEVVPHAAAVITNGGYGGVQHALAHGIPLAVAGTTEDKPEVAARVAWTGAGIDLRTARPTQDQVRDAVHRLLHDPRYRQAAERIRDDYARHDPPAEAADLLEQTAASSSPLTAYPLRR